MVERTRADGCEKAVEPSSNTAVEGRQCGGVVEGAPREGGVEDWRRRNVVEEKKFGKRGEAVAEGGFS